MHPHTLAQYLKGIYNDALLAVVLYGSSAGRDFSKKYSDCNLLVVLKETSAGELARAATPLRQWTSKGNPSPLFLTPAHIATSADVFPIEFLDMQARHNVLVGIDPFEGLTIDHRHLRHACESELKGKLLHLRSFFAVNVHRPKAVMQMMLATFPAFLATMRGVVHLLGEKPLETAREVIEQLEKNISFNPQPFFDLIAIREGEALPHRGSDVLAALERYLTELEAVTTFVDHLA